MTQVIPGPKGRQGQKTGVRQPKSIISRMGSRPEWTISARWRFWSPKVALFPASSAADYITGSLVTVDGGALLM